MRPRSRHYAMVLSGLGAGGAERVVAELSRHWIGHGARVTVIAFDDPAAPIYHSLPDGVETVRFGLEPAGASFLAARRMLALRQWLRRERPDLLLSFLTKINAIALASTIGLAVPVIACERNNPERQRMNPAWNRALALLYPRAAAIVCQTRASVRCLPRRARRLAQVIPNPISARAPIPEAAGRPVLVAVGRLTEQKGFDLLIAAFAHVAAAFPDWRLDIWGDGPDRTALLAQVARLGLFERVRLRGISAVPQGWAAEGGTFVLSSRYEGFPNVLGEAMAAGLPCISTDCDFGPAEMIDSDRSGLLVRVDDVAKLAEGLTRIMQDEKRRERLARAAPKAVARFAPEHVLVRWDRLTDTVLNVGRTERHRSPTI